MRCDIHVGWCTPLVTWPIGTFAVGRSGQRSRHSRRDSSPCRFETPFTLAEQRIASTAMWNCPWSRTGW